MTLTPTFDSAVLSYTATTTDDANTVTATPTDETVDVEIKLGSTEITNGGSATWVESANELKITVSADGVDTVYTVTVTKE